MQLRVFVLITAILFLNACVEIKDPDQDPGFSPVAPPTLVENMNNLVVDQDLFLFQGQVLTREQWLRAALFQEETPVVYQFENLEIKKGAVLYTSGQNVRIEVKKFLSEGSIATFPEGVTAPDYQPGHDGGMVNLKIEKAEGFLKVILRGENGGKGLPGKEHDRALQGDPGAPLSLSDCDNRVAIEKWHGKKGKKGYPGGEGFSGGKSGSLNLEVGESAHFSFHFDRIPGLGGNGGDPSPRGGRRGDNGPTGCVLRGFVLNLPEQPEFIGDPGDRGNPGKDGIAEPVCETRNQQKVCY